MTTAATPTPFERSVVHVADDASMHVHPKDPALWADPGRGVLTEGSLVSVFSYDRTWDEQERHPVGDELVVVLDGSVDLLLDAGEGERATAVRSGELALIPEGSWHRLAIHEPSTLLFITPRPAATEHRQFAAG